MSNTLKVIKSKLVKPDGTLNGKIISGLVGLAILLVQQICAAFGLQLKGNTASIVAVINTLLTLLGVLGVLSDPTPVVLDDVKTKEEK